MRGGERHLRLAATRLLGGSGRVGTTGGSGVGLALASAAGLAGRSCGWGAGGRGGATALLALQLLDVLSLCCGGLLAKSDEHYENEQTALKDSSERKEHGEVEGGEVRGKQGRRRSEGKSDRAVK